MKYTPAEAFSKGEDQFVLSLNNNEITFKVIVGSIPDTVCNIGAQYDKVAINTATPYEIDVLANDVFCAGINTSSLKITAAPTNGQAIVANNKITYTSSPGFEGLDTLIYSVSSNDSTQGSASAEVWIFVFNPDICHLALVPDDFTTSLNTSITLDVLANDNLCTTISPSTLYISEQPKNGTIAIVEGKLFYTPSAGYTGYEYFSYALVDDQGNVYPVPVKGYIQ